MYNTCKPSRGNRALKTVVEKASLSSAIEQGLVDPKCRAYELIIIDLTEKFLYAKGKCVNIHIHSDGCICSRGDPMTLPITLMGCQDSFLFFLI